MDLPAPLAWLVDEASASTGPDRFLAELGSRLLADGLPLAGGALALAVPHPIIARRTFLWRAETGAVIESLAFAGAAPMLTSHLLGRPRCARPCGQPHSGPSHVTLPPPARGQVRRSGLVQAHPGPDRLQGPASSLRGFSFGCSLARGTGTDPTKQGVCERSPTSSARWGNGAVLTPTK